MKKNQQTATKRTTTTEAERGLVNFVKWAKEQGFTEEYAVKLLKISWEVN